jgi:hypothetical protein
VTYQYSPLVVHAHKDIGRLLVDPDEPFLPPLCASTWLRCDVDDESKFETTAMSTTHTDVLQWSTHVESTSTDHRIVEVVVEKRYRQLFDFLMKSTALPECIVAHIVQHI